MGMQVFHTVLEAIRNGYQVYEHCPKEWHIKVRRRADSTHWALALVVLDQTSYLNVYRSTPE